MTQIVLVHGAWHGSWCWEGVLAELRDRKIDAVAVELPFTGFADDVESARSAIAADGEHVVVIAHSYGGAVVSQAVSELTKVVHLVFLAAFVNPGDASALIDRPLSLLEAIVRDGDLCSFDPKFAQTIFYGDSAPDVVATIVPRLRPMVLDVTAMLATPSIPPAVPSTYVVCTRDGAIPVQAQLQMAQRADRVIEWPTDHSPFLTRPGDLADLLVERLHPDLHEQAVRADPPSLGSPPHPRIHKLQRDSTVAIVQVVDSLCGALDAVGGRGQTAGPG